MWKLLTLVSWGHRISDTVEGNLWASEGRVPPWLILMLKSISFVLHLQLAWRDRGKCLDWSDQVQARCNLWDVTFSERLRQCGCGGCMRAYLRESRGRRGTEWRRCRCDRRRCWVAWGIGSWISCCCSIESLCRASNGEALSPPAFSGMTNSDAVWAISLRLWLIWACWTCCPYTL